MKNKRPSAAKHEIRPKPENGNEEIAQDLRIEMASKRPPGILALQPYGSAPIAESSSHQAMTPSVK